MNRILTLLIFVFVLVSLTACSDYSAVVSAKSLLANGDATVSAMGINASARTQACGLGDTQLMINTVQGQASTLTLDQWLDQNTHSFTCITPKGE